MLCKTVSFVIFTATGFGLELNFLADSVPTTQIFIDTL
jgi:hypothetical protein